MALTNSIVHGPPPLNHGIRYADAVTHAPARRVGHASGNAPIRHGRITTTGFYCVIVYAMLINQFHG